MMGKRVQVAERGEIVRGYGIAVDCGGERVAIFNVDGVFIESPD